MDSHPKPARRDIPHPDYADLTDDQIRARLMEEVARVVRSDLVDLTWWMASRYRLPY